MDQLERKVEILISENSDFRKRVENLESKNASLLSQVASLQSVVARGRKWCHQQTEWRHTSLHIAEPCSVRIPSRVPQVAQSTSPDINPSDVYLQLHKTRPRAFCEVTRIVDIVCRISAVPFRSVYLNVYFGCIYISKPEVQREEMSALEWLLTTYS